MMSHSFINVVIPFECGRSEAVNGVLRDLKREGNRPLPDIERTLTEMGVVHFMSITVVEAVCPAEKNAAEKNGSTEAHAPAQRQASSHLVIELSADGGTEETLTLLAHRMGPELSRILVAANVTLRGESLEAYLLRHSRVIGASWGSDALGQVFTGSPGMSAKRIRDEETLAARTGALIEKFRREPSWYGISPRQRLERLRNYLWVEGGWKWAFVPEATPCLAGDPHNKWRADVAVSNPQLWKFGVTIVHELLWPLYLPFGLIVFGVLFLAWFELGWKVALMWTGYVAGGLLLALALVLGLAWRTLRRREKRDAVEDRTPPSSQVEKLMEVENFCPQNSLASVSRLKPGLLRRLTLRLAFNVVGAARFVCAPGFLGKNGVIHFARWMRLPGTDQLLFLSNYDGTWGSYVADFIADAPSGVTGIWSNCVGFPRTQNLFVGGAQNRDWLVRWARRQQHPTTFWYSAYRRLTAERIRMNAAIRQGIASAETNADARDWFALFSSPPRLPDAPRDPLALRGSQPQPPESLEIAQIPTLIFGGLSGLPFAERHLIAFGEDASIDDCKAWLSAAATHAAYGLTLPGQKSAIVVALSAHGLEKLGIPDDAIGTFPVAFQQGMWPKWRARALGDDDDNGNGNSPERWVWGGSRVKPVDVFLVVYGLSQDDVDKTRNELLDEANKLGHRAMHPLPLAPLPEKGPVKEHFGFTDGVSQPVIRGTPRSRRPYSPNDLVAPGEIVLGYPDNLGRIPPSPSISDEHDPDRLLPDAGPDPLRRRPEFSRYEGNGRRDLGVNGTFLVVRQLSQNVKAFQDWLDAALDGIENDAVVATDSKRTAIVWGDRAQEKVGATLPRPRRDAITTDLKKKEVRERVRDAIAAKLIGRWKDGTSLARNVLTPGGQEDPPLPPDNDFLLGAEDPAGYGCPFGAHIRRANPRDTRFPKSQEEIATINRHRILRVGRPYGEPYQEGRDESNEEDPRGLLFMCLNADIERQFEFIQRTWLLNPNLHGLENEVDPILGHGFRHVTIPTPTGPVLLRGIEKKDQTFVTVKGGGYFFLPGRDVLRFLATKSRTASGGDALPVSSGL
jgi:deferrochelatase/peroxidase EfeB